MIRPTHVFMIALGDAMDACRNIEDENHLVRVLEDFTTGILGPMPMLNPDEMKLLAGGRLVEVVKMYRDRTKRKLSHCFDYLRKRRDETAQVLSASQLQASVGERSNLRK